MKENVMTPFSILFVLVLGTITRAYSYDWEFPFVELKTSATTNFATSMKSLEAACEGAKATNDLFHVDWSPAVAEADIRIDEGIFIRGQTGHAFDILAKAFRLECLHTPTGPFFLSTRRRQCAIPIVISGNIEIPETSKLISSVHMAVLFRDGEMFFPENTICDSTGRFLSVIQMPDELVENEVGVRFDNQLHEPLASVKGVVLHSAGFFPATNCLSILPLRASYRMRFQLTPAHGSETTNSTGPPFLEDPVSGFGFIVPHWRLIENGSIPPPDEHCSGDPFNWEEERP